MGKSFEKTMDYESYLRMWFSVKLNTLTATYNLHSVNEAQRNLQLAEVGLNFVVYKECRNNTGTVDYLFQHYGHFCFVSGDYLFLIVPYVDDKLVCAFPESQSDEVMTVESISNEVKAFRDKFLKGKRVIVYETHFYTNYEEKAEGEFINDYGKFFYSISCNFSYSDEGENYD